MTNLNIISSKLLLFMIDVLTRVQDNYPMEIFQTTLGQIRPSANSICNHFPKKSVYSHYSHCWYELELYRYIGHTRN